MAKEYILLVAEGCQGCEEALQTIKAKGSYKVLDITKSLRAADIAKKLGIKAVPTVVEVDRDADKMCALDYEELTVKCAKYSQLVSE